MCWCTRQRITRYLCGICAYALMHWPRCELICGCEYYKCKIKRNTSFRILYGHVLLKESYSRGLGFLIPIQPIGNWCVFYRMFAELYEGKYNVTIPLTINSVTDSRITIASGVHSTPPHLRYFCSGIKKWRALIFQIKPLNPLYHCYTRCWRIDANSRIRFICVLRASKTSMSGAYFFMFNLFFVLTAFVPSDLLVIFDSRYSIAMQLCRHRYAEIYVCGFFGVFFFFFWGIQNILIQQDRDGVG